VEQRDDLEKILLSGLDDDEREKTMKAIRDEDARQLRRARRGFEQSTSSEAETDGQSTSV
jgi:hypothetical protein